MNDLNVKITIMKAAKNCSCSNCKKKATLVVLVRTATWDPINIYCCSRCISTVDLSIQPKTIMEVIYST